MLQSFSKYSTGSARRDYTSIQHMRAYFYMSSHDILLFWAWYLHKSHCNVCLNAMIYARQLLRTVVYDRRDAGIADEAAKVANGETVVLHDAKKSSISDDEFQVRSSFVRWNCIGAARRWPQITSYPSLAALVDCPQPCHAVEIMDPFAWITIQDWTWPEHWK